jgi:hypothetical protein
MKMPARPLDFRQAVADELRDVPQATRSLARRISPSRTSTACTHSCANFWARSRSK